MQSTLLVHIVAANVNSIFAFLLNTNALSNHCLIYIKSRISWGNRNRIFFASTAYTKRWITNLQRLRLLKRISLCSKSHCRLIRANILFTRNAQVLNKSCKVTFVLNAHEANIVIGKRIGNIAISWTMSYFGISLTILTLIQVPVHSRCRPCHCRRWRSYCLRFHVKTNLIRNSGEKEIYRFSRVIKFDGST